MFLPARSVDNWQIGIWTHHQTLDIEHGANVYLAKIYASYDGRN